jgi:putative membrane protein
MTGTALILGGVAVLALAWGGPLPGLVPESFTAHMTLHMLVVAVGAPLLAIGLADRYGRGRLADLSPAVPAVLTVVDLIVVWGWHTPALHDMTRAMPAVLAVEQASFALVTLALWFTAFSGPPLAGALALFFTSMHMTLLGALLGLGGRSLYGGPGTAFGALCLTPVADQHVGGAVMLGVGGAVYLVAGLWLVSRLLNRPATP